MSIAELETAVATLSPEKLSEFSTWFEEYLADQWDKKFDADVAAGKLDHMAAKADEDFESGRCTPL
jgi:hypothetical protein